MPQPGSPGNVFTTNVTRSFRQTATGTYGLDLQFLDQTSDRINFTGTANAAGYVAINILNPGLALPGSHDTTILSAAGGVTSHSGLAEVHEFKRAAHDHGAISVGARLSISGARRRHRRGCGRNSGRIAGLALNRQISLYANFTSYLSVAGNSLGGFGGVKLSW